MSYASHASRYKQNDVLSASPGQLVVMLYDHLLASLRRARIAMDGGNAEARGAQLHKAREVLSELLVTLDHARGGEVATQLGALYTFFLRELVDIGVRRDSARLDRVTAMVQELRDAFAQVQATGAGSTATRMVR